MIQETSKLEKSIGNTLLNLMKNKEHRNKVDLLFQDYQKIVKNKINKGKRYNDDLYSSVINRFANYFC